MRRKAHIDCSCKMIHVFLAHLPTASLLQKIQDTVSPTDLSASQSHTRFFPVDREVNNPDIHRLK